MTINLVIFRCDNKNLIIFIVFSFTDEWNEYGRTDELRGGENKEKRSQKCELKKKRRSTQANANYKKLQFIRCPDSFHMFLYSLNDYRLRSNTETFNAPRPKVTMAIVPEFMFP